MGNDLIIIMIIPNDNNNNDNNVHILVLVLTYLVSFLLAFCGAVIVGKLRVASGNWQSKGQGSGPGIL